jgi:hypothetical protein
LASPPVPPAALSHRCAQPGPPPVPRDGLLRADWPPTVHTAALPACCTPPGVSPVLPSCSRDAAPDRRWCRRTRSRAAGPRLVPPVRCSAVSGPVAGAAGRAAVLRRADGPSAGAIRPIFGSRQDESRRRYRRRRAAHLRGRLRFRCRARARRRRA